MAFKYFQDRLEPGMNNESLIQAYEENLKDGDLHFAIYILGRLVENMTEVIGQRFSSMHGKISGLETRELVGRQTIEELEAAAKIKDERIAELEAELKLQNKSISRNRKTSGLKNTI